MLPLLALLVTGVPDVVIARQLGLSYRTFQRRLHELMGRLGAETRFQAGIRAVQLGWAADQITGAFGTIATAARQFVLPTSPTASVIPS